MIKLFSLNHTRTRKFLILAQDKTQFRRVTVLIFRVRNTSASAHTNYLVNFLKSVEPLLNQGRVFYRESRPCQPFVFSSFETLKTTKSHPAYCFNRGAHSTPNRYLVNPSRKLFINRFPRKFKQLPPPAPALRTVPVRSGAHSTAPRKTVNGLREKNSKSSVSTYVVDFKTHNLTIKPSISLLPGASGCVFQTKVATDSRRSLPPIPRESCH